MRKIPVSVIIVTKNEASRIARCLAALQEFSEIIVVDSNSTDDTAALARAAGVRVETFLWNGHYPKKRQWCLDHLTLAHDWVFFVDADEIVPLVLTAEIKALDFAAAGYFVRGRYVIGGRALRHGVCNNKLCLFDRRKIEFPVVDDLNLPGMGEIEGHYQPILKAEYKTETIGQLKVPLDHYALEDEASWRARHERYAAWERAMIARGAYPVDPVPGRERLKRIFRRLPSWLRAALAFGHSYGFKAGFLDGAAGLRLARRRAEYYFLLRKDQYKSGT